MRTFAEASYNLAWLAYRVNKRHRLVEYSPESVVKWLLPARVKSALKRFSRPRGG